MLALVRCNQLRLDEIDILASSLTVDVLQPEALQFDCLSQVLHILIFNEQAPKPGMTHLQRLQTWAEKLYK